MRYALFLLNIEIELLNKTDNCLLISQDFASVGKAANAKMLGGIGYLFGQSKISFLAHCDVFMI